MVRLWATRVERGMNTLDDVPAVYLEAVKKELGIVDEPEQEEPEAPAEITEE
ncbi:hypothetical protein HWB91_gp09 [Bacillus phage vB_BboS-125]|uniref:Uncharacterized protein n=1 Tax=Bacillus phage vB_BboS-125 TaxID=2419618 RepID=A0A3G3BVT6_9CAUD|nr:hypothetical protein HWB91_gp09 [Bacillus phage vB_BboS-125]AYP68379.1 hypothetical protein BboS125_00009 [Bacillus phage vB_BboS-125]